LVFGEELSVCGAQRVRERAMGGRGVFGAGRHQKLTLRSAALDPGLVSAWRMVSTIASPIVAR
jgi:hypothetical protein